MRTGFDTQIQHPARSPTRAAINTPQWDYERIEEVSIPAKVPPDPIEAVIGATVDEFTTANVYVVGSGWGDGTYATYIGRLQTQPSQASSPTSGYCPPDKHPMPDRRSDLPMRGWIRVADVSSMYEPAPESEVAHRSGPGVSR